MIIHRARYVCLEGLDGSGKSTTTDLLKKMLGNKGISFSVCNPTQRILNDDWIEVMFARSEWMRGSSLLRAFIYARRSQWAALNTDWSRPLVLGDRSIITSYVTRWRRWGNCPTLSIRIVDFLEPVIPAPGLVFYLDVPHDLLMERLESRDRKKDIDETPERSMAMRRAYEEIIGGIFQPVRLGNTRFVRIKVLRGMTPEDIASGIVDKILVDLTGKNDKGNDNNDSVSFQAGKRTPGKANRKGTG